MAEENDPIEKVVCPSCGDKRNCYVRASYARDDDYGNIPVNGCLTGSILECCGCSQVFYRETYWFSEVNDIVTNPITGEQNLEPVLNTRFWPPLSARNRPEWFNSVVRIDSRLQNLLSEVYRALDGDLWTLAGIGVRTCIDRSTELVDIDPDLSFGDKLNALLDDGRIGTSEKDILGTLIDAGGAAAHRGWEPSENDLRTMMDVLEQFIHRTFFLGEESSQLRERVPQRKRKKKSS